MREVRGMHMFALFFLLLTCLLGLVVNSTSYFSSTLAAVIFLIYSFQARYRAELTLHAVIASCRDAIMSRCHHALMASSSSTQALMKQQSITSLFEDSTGVNEGDIAASTPSELWAAWMQPLQATAYMNQGHVTHSLSRKILLTRVM